MSTPPEQVEPEDSDDQDAIERISDPDDYNLRRRLRQLHDAKDNVAETKNRVLRLEAFDREFTATQRDRFVAEAITDYISELRPLLAKAGREGDFLRAKVATVNDQELSIEDILTERGRIELEDERVPIPYEASMHAWDECNDHFEQVAGVVFDKEEAGPGDNPIDPAGRFDE